MSSFDLSHDQAHSELWLCRSKPGLEKPEPPLIWLEVEDFEAP
jgi:hypothetical protein